jgi:hypothetical protein
VQAAGTCTSSTKFRYLSTMLVLYHCFKKKNCITRSCPILVLTTVLGRPRHADAENDAENYQGPTTFGENAIRKFLPHVFLNFSVIMT